MKTRYHFISGLPRSGSTLLAALLRQNPRFQAEMSSPVASLFMGVLQQVSAGSEIAPQVTIGQRRRLLRGLFDAYYAEQNDKEVIFDTNRLWCARLPTLLDLFPEAKVIACVRNVAWVMDSIERLYRSNPYENTRLFQGISRSTVYSRLEGLAQHESLVGFAWSALREAFFGDQAASLLVVDYDLLARTPAKVMPLIYAFLNEEPFTHDFDHVEYDAPEFDTALGLSGLHRIRPQVRLIPRTTILPPDLFKKFADLSFWHDTRCTRANLIIAQPVAGSTSETPAAERV